MNVIKKFFKSQELSIIKIIFSLLCLIYTSYKYIFIYKDSAIYNVVNKKKIKFNKKNKIFFICAFNEMNSLYNLSSVNQIEQSISKEKADFYYLFVLNEASDVNFAFIDAIVLKNNLNKEKCVYIFANDSNNFVKQHKIYHYPSLIILNKENKEKYRYIGFLNENQTHQINSVLNEK